MRRMWLTLVGTIALVASACSGGDDAASPATTDLFSPDSDPAFGEDNHDEESANDPLPMTGGAVDRPEVQPLSCGSIFDLDDADVALGLLDLPFSERSVFQLTQGETCGVEWAGDSSRTASVSPGLPSDLEAGAELVGVPGEAIDGVGDAASWFGGATEGVLAVQASTTLGELNFRITLGRPDIDDALRRATAIEVAARILPKFPGVERPPPPEVDLAALRGTADRSGDDLVERLSAGEAAGDWTRGEGLIELLGPLVDSDPPANTGDIDGFGLSGTGLVTLAREYVREGDDPVAADELRALLDRALPSRERIEAATPTTTTTTSTTTTTTPAVNAFRRSAEPSDECAERFNGYCIVTINFDDLDQAYGTDKYLMFTPAGVASNDFGPWPNDAVGWVIEAIRASANTFEGLGTMPDTSVLLGGDGNAPAMSDATPDLCSVALRTSILAYPKAQVQQFVAGEMAHCFLAATFTNIHGTSYNPSTWWSGGLAIWLSTLVYPSANLEWIHLPSALTGHELQTSTFQRTATNWMWFQHLQWEYGTASLLGLIGNLPSNAGEHPDFVTTWPNMERISHEFAESLSDLGVPDSGANQMAGAYEPPADLIEVDAPTSLLDNVDQFRVGRVELIVLNGDVACIDAEQIDGATLTWRPGRVRQTGLWSEDLPKTLTGEATFAASSLDDGAAFRITVNDVVEDEDECEPEDDGADDAEGDDCQIECGFSEYYSRPGG